MSDDILNDINIIDDDGGANLGERSPHWTRLKAIGSPESEPRVQVICAQSVILKTERHATGENRGREIGGLLLGDAYQHQGTIYIEITQYLPAKSGSASQSSRTHFEFTPQIWSEMLQRKDLNYDHLKVVGWFHSHPGHGIFLSQGMDTVIQGEYFKQPWQTAMVYDPLRHEGGFFVWRNDSIVPAPGFYELLDSRRQQSVVDWQNLAKTVKPEPLPQPLEVDQEPAPPKKRSTSGKREERDLLTTILTIISLMLVCVVAFAGGIFFTRSDKGNQWLGSLGFPPPSPALSPIPTPSSSPVSSASAIPPQPTEAPTNTPTSTPTNTPTSTPTNTPTSTPTNTPITPVPTLTPTPDDGAPPRPEGAEPSSELSITIPPNEENNTFSQGRPITFTAVLSPENTSPFSYTWQATNQQLERPPYSNTITFTWNIIGSQIITVSAKKLVATKTITIAAE